MKHIGNVGKTTEWPLTLEIGLPLVVTVPQARSQVSKTLVKDNQSVI